MPAELIGKVYKNVNHDYLDVSAYEISVGKGLGDDRDLQ